MSYRELLVSQPNAFGGFQKSFERADYVILGVPLTSQAHTELERDSHQTPSDRHR